MTEIERQPKSRWLRNFVIACAVLVPLLWILMARLDDGRPPVPERPEAPALQPAP